MSSRSFLIRHMVFAATLNLALAFLVTIIVYSWFAYGMTMFEYSLAIPTVLLLAAAFTLNCVDIAVGKKVLDGADEQPAFDIKRAVPAQDPLTGREDRWV